MAQLRRTPVSTADKKTQNPIAKAMGRARHSSFYHDLSLRGKQPLRLLGTPKDIWPGSVTAGTQIVGGKFIAGGQVLQNPGNNQNVWLEGDIWLATDLSEKWLEHLHSFSWLKDLNQSVDRNSAKKRAEILVKTWMQHNTQWGEVSWRADIVGERITNWLIYAPLIMDTDDVTYRASVLDTLARSARHLMKVSSDINEGPSGLRAIMGLIFSGLFIPLGDRWLKQGLSLLKFTLGKEILVDGGIRTRNPQEHLYLFMTMVLLRDAFTGMGEKIPPELSLAVGRMASNLKTMMHGDGKLPLFNGVIIQNHEDIPYILLKAKEEDCEIVELEQSGFKRIEAGRTVIIQDVGPPAEQGMSKSSHAGALSFELSRGKERLIVNCGSAEYAGRNIDENLAAFARATAAHSTLVINDQNSSDIHDDGFIGRGIINANCLRLEEGGHTMLEAEHDGYVAPYDYKHRRLLYMNDVGDDIRGEDNIEHINKSENGEKAPFDVRFHLHPDVSVRQSVDNIELTLESGECWIFKYHGADCSIEESLYLGNAGKISSSKQLVLSSKVDGASTKVFWSFKLCGG